MNFSAHCIILQGISTWHAEHFMINCMAFVQYLLLKLTVVEIQCSYNDKNKCQNRRQNIMDRIQERIQT